MNVGANIFYIHQLAPSFKAGFKSNNQDDEGL